MNPPTFIRHPSLAGVEVRVVKHGGVRSPPTPPMVTSDLKVALVLRGANRFRYRSFGWVAPKGTLILAEPGEVHAVESVDGAFQVLILFLDPQAVAGLRRSEVRDLREGLSFRNPLNKDRAGVQAFQSLVSALGDTSSSALLVEERLLTSVEALTRAYAGRHSQPESTADASAVRRARDMLHDLYRESITLDDLAKQSGLPKARFLRAFKRLVGVPPHAYQVHLRVDQARRLLASGAGISDAALATGFVDQSHFHRHFRRLHGLTPAQYRNR